MWHVLRGQMERGVPHPLRSNSGNAKDGAPWDSWFVQPYWVGGAAAVGGAVSRWYLVKNFQAPSLTSSKDVAVAAGGVGDDVEFEGEAGFDEGVVLVGHHAEVVVGILVADPVLEGLLAGGVGEEGVVGGVEDGGVDGGGGPVVGVVDADGEGVEASAADAEEVDAGAVDGVFFVDFSRRRRGGREGRRSGCSKGCCGGPPGR
jgi:hypothetical protein